MSWIEASIMAVIQGLTEFLPVSSSGHLALASSLMEVPEGSLAFDIVLHLGTLLAVLVFYRKDIVDIITGVFRGERRSIMMAVTLVAATVPVAILGLLAGDFIEGLFDNILFVSCALAFTGTVLFLTGGRMKETSPGIPFRKGLLVGAAQALAIFPGVSRSGMTICAGLKLGFSREEAARFSFLLSIPAIAGAAVKELPEAQWNVSTGVLLTGFTVAAVVGFAALALLVRFVKAGKLRGFAWYCWAVAIAGLVFWVTGA